MTNTKRTPVPDNLSTAIEHLDLTPGGLADAPASKRTPKASCTLETAKTVVPSARARPGNYA